MEKMTTQPVTGGKRSAWMSHVKQTMKANKGKSLMQVLKMAKKTYKKTAKRGGAGGVAATAGSVSGDAPTGGRRRTRKSKKTRKH